MSHWTEVPLTRQAGRQRPNNSSFNQRSRMAGFCASFSLPLPSLPLSRHRACHGSRHVTGPPPLLPLPWESQMRNGRVKRGLAGRARRPPGSVAICESGLIIGTGSQGGTTRPKPRIPLTTRTCRGLTTLIFFSCGLEGQPCHCASFWEATGDKINKTRSTA